MALVNRFPLTTNCIDIVGGIIATNNNGVTFDTNNGAYFNGTNQSLNFSYANYWNQPLSISVWAKFSNALQNAALIYSCDSGASYRTGLMYTSLSSYAWINDKALTAGYDYNSNNYPRNQFVLCTMTWDGSSLLKIYRGNCLINSSVITPNTSTMMGSYSMGVMGNDLVYYFNGYLKDVRMYNHCLSQQEVSYLYYSGLKQQLNIPAFPQTSIESYLQ